MESYTHTQFYDLIYRCVCIFYVYICFIVLHKYYFVHIINIKVICDVTAKNQVVNISTYITIFTNKSEGKPIN